jgi:multidrug efflux system outer membrane protein
MKFNSLTPWFFLLAVLPLAACNVGKRYVKPTIPSGLSYSTTESTDTSKILAWFQLYRDTALQQLIRTALDSNKDILTASARIDEARAQAAISRASLYPQLGYQVQAGEGKAGINSRRAAGGLDGTVISGYGVLTWELDIWGKFRAGKRSAIASYFAVIDNRNALQVSLIAEVASEYFLLRDLNNRLSIAHKTLKGRKDYTKIISEKFEKGYLPELDKLMAIQQEAEVAAVVPSLERQIAEVQNSLRLLMGMGPGMLVCELSNFEEATFPEIPIALPSQLLQRRPDILAAENTLHAQFEQIGVAQANRFPSISLTGILGLASPQLKSLVTNNSTTSSAIGGLTGPLFNFGQLRNQVTIQKSRTNQALYAYQAVVLKAFSDVDNSLEYLKTYSEEYHQRKVQTSACAKALILSKARYDHGFTSFLEVLIQENNLFNAQLAESAALQGKLNATVMLYKSLGGGW